MTDRTQSRPESVGPELAAHEGHPHWQGPTGRDLRAIAAVEAIPDLEAGYHPQLRQGYRRGINAALDAFRAALRATNHQPVALDVGLLARAIDAADAHEWDLGGSQKWAAEVPAREYAALAKEPSDEDEDAAGIDPNGADFEGLWHGGPSDG